MKEFAFDGQNVAYGYNWKDENTFQFDFGDFLSATKGEFFVACEYHKKEDEFSFSLWLEDGKKDSVETVFTDFPKESVIAFMRELMNEENTVRDGR